MDNLSFLGFWKRLLSGFDWTPLKRSSMFILESCQVRKLEIGWQKNFKTGQSAIKWKLFGLQSHLTCCHLTIGSGVPVTNTSRKQSQNLLKNWWKMSLIMPESFPNKIFYKVVMDIYKRAGCCLGLVVVVEHLNLGWNLTRENRSYLAML